MIIRLTSLPAVSPLPNCGLIRFSGLHQVGFAATNGTGRHFLRRCRQSVRRSRKSSRCIRAPLLTTHYTSLNAVPRDQADPKRRLGSSLDTSTFSHALLKCHSKHPIILLSHRAVKLLIGYAPLYCCLYLYCRNKDGAIGS